VPRFVPEWGEREAGERLGSSEPPVRALTEPLRQQTPLSGSSKERLNSKDSSLRWQFSSFIKATGENHRRGNESTFNVGGNHVNKSKFRHRSLKNGY